MIQIRQLLARVLNQTSLFFLTDTVISTIYFYETIPKHSSLHNINKDSWLVDITQNIVHFQRFWIWILCKKVFNCLQFYLILCSLNIRLGSSERQTQSVFNETRLQFPTALHFYSFQEWLLVRYRTWNEGAVWSKWFNHVYIWRCHVNIL